MAEIFSSKELLLFNGKLLGRGMPNTVDGIGYNKADYGVCNKYYDGLSNAQLADLAKRLVKYTNTQLKVDKPKMKHTALYYDGLTTKHAKDGVSIDIGLNYTAISFKYNDIFIKIIKDIPYRKWNKSSKLWKVPNNRLLETLELLQNVGADVTNAYYLANNCSIMDVERTKKATVLVDKDELETNVSFDYRKEVVDAIKELPERRYFPNTKTWSFPTAYLPKLEKKLENVCLFINRTNALNI